MVATSSFAYSATFQTQQLGRQTFPGDMDITFASHHTTQPQRGTEKAVRQEEEEAFCKPRLAGLSGFHLRLS